MGISARLKKIRPGYRTMSVLAGTAVFAGAAFFVTTGANADTQPVPKAFDSYKKPTGSATPRAAVNGSSVRNKLPNARKTTRTEYKLGKTGPAFQPPITKRIIGGTPVLNAADHPYIIGIQTLYWELEGDQFVGWISTCTGTVLSPTKVLTAGHCAHDSQHGTTYAIAGRTNLDDETSGGFVTTVRSTFIHQGYVENNGAPDNDVAVLTLVNPLPAAYTPVTLDAQGASDVADGTTAQIIGYGVTSLSQNDQGILRQGTVAVRSDATCANELGSEYHSATMVCGGTPGNGVDVCAGDSGGPLFATKNGTKTEIGIVSWGAGSECNQYHSAYAQVSAYNNAITADKNRKSPNNLDWTGDGHSDLLARDGSGNLLMYSGSGLVNSYHPAAFGPDAAWIGEGWGGFRKMFRVWNWNGDNKPSIFAVDAANNLIQYKGDGEGGFVSSGGIGNGWNFTDIMVTNNWTGNGRPNLLGRSANGDLWLYTSNGSGGWENGGSGIKIGVGWNAFNTIITPGEWLGDGRQALIGRTPTGDLRLYQSNGQGGWVNGMGVKIGNGWSAFSIFMSPGDFNGDNLVDMIGVTPAGAMRLYTTDGQGNWLGGGVGQQIGTGWNAYNAIF